MGSNKVHKTGLELSLGSDLDDHTENNKKNKKKRSVITTSLKYDHLCPSDLRLGSISIAISDGPDHPTSPDRVLHRQASSLSSFSTSSASTTPIVIKRDRDVISGEEAELDLQRRVISGRSNNDDREDIDEEQGSPRKKLRLTKQQAALLEDSFRDHTTLNPKQKQELARELNLRPRQVEVWFQNRRARNKLKQTEADYEQWKKCCEMLTEQNKRLQKELQELRSLKLIMTPFYTPFTTSPPVVCPSCQRLGPSTTNESHHFTSASFTPSNQHPSAAC